MQSKSIPFLVVIVGPTAVGKTELAVEIAERIGGEIISADSRLFYRGMDIGTAKPSAQDQQRVIHHLVDIANPDQTLSLALFQKETRRLIFEVWDSGHIPILVGGTGQFIRAVTEEWGIPPQPPDQRLRLAIEQWGMDIGAVEIHRRLSLIDPNAAAIIEPNNLRRTVRALEVIFMTGRLFSEQRTRQQTPYHLCQIGLIRPRDDLYRRVDERIDQMIANGLLEETRQLLLQGYTRTLPAFSAIGYSEMVDVLDGVLTLDDAVTIMKRRTRNFIRRQANWFKQSDTRIKWFTLGETTLKDATTYILTRKADLAAERW